MYDDSWNCRDVRIVRVGHFHQPAARDGGSGASAGTGPRALRHRPQKAETAKGELRSVDAAKKTLTVAVEGGSAQTFMYTDTTKVSGAQGGVEGLASMSGRTVTVQYTMKDADRIASSIEVAAK